MLTSFEKANILPALCLALILASLPGIARGASGGDKEVYGSDDRRDIYEVTAPEVRAAARAVCAFVPSEYLIAREGGYFELDLAQAEDITLTLCEDEAFAAQPQVSWCTGFLVGSDVIATAGHCVKQGDELEDFASFRIVFGYQMLNATTVATVYAPEQVYSVVNAEAVRFSGQTDVDYAVLRLDRAVELPGVTPLVLRRAGEIGEGKAVGVIGHPLGLPMKASFGGDTVVYPDAFGYPNSIITNFDASAGSSGSPVFNQDTGLVEGIYIFSFVDDVIFDEDCGRINRVPNEEAGQGVLKASLFRRAVYQAIGISNEGEGEGEGKAPACAAAAGDSGPRSVSGDLLVVLWVSAVLGFLRGGPAMPNMAKHKVANSRREV